MSDTETTRLVQLQQQFESGDGRALLSAVNCCLNSDMLAPDWIVTAFNEAWDVRWELGQARTLGDAFGIHRPKGWSQKRSRKNALMGRIWTCVEEYREQHVVPINRDLFEVVAEEWNQQAGSELVDSMVHGLKINGTDVQVAYYEMQKIIKKLVTRHSK